MSLTSLIAKDKELRDRIRSTFSRPKLDRTKPILAEPRSKRYGLIGTAFDYLFMFYLERLNSVRDDKRLWIADHAIERLDPNTDAYNVGKEIIRGVRELRNEFLETGKMTVDLIRETLRMSYIDPVFRAGAGAQYIGEDADKSDIEDVQKLFSLIDADQFRSKELCILSPTFGEASRLVGGADADFLLDDKLIDIKATKSLELKLSHFCQIVGYLILHRIGGMNGKKELEINQLGIYFARHQYLFLFDVQDLITDNSLQDFTEWFERRFEH